MGLYEPATAWRTKVSILAIILFTVLTPAAFWLLTFAWHRLVHKQHQSRSPAVWIILGMLVFVPVDFVIVSHFLKPNSMSFADALKGLLGMYAILPLSTISITTYQATLPGLLLAIVAVLHATDYAKRVTTVRVQTHSH